jgi:secondary thiamine-phosphate synthase enzyme
MVKTGTISLDTEGRDEIINITGEVQKLVRESGIHDGIALIFVPGATGAVSTTEYEPGLIRDIPEAMEAIIPQEKNYHHDETWHDGNGHSHLRATLIGPSLTVPVSQGSPVLGTWQQIIFLEFDNKPHLRKIIVQIVGD